MNREWGDLDVETKETLSTDIPEEAKQILQEQDGYLWEAVTEATFNTFGGERLTSPAALEREIERAKRQRRDAVEDLREARNEVERQEQRIEDLEQRRENLLDQRTSTQEALDQLLDDMVSSGSRVDSGHGQVKAIARRYYGGEKNIETVLEDLRDRAADREMGLADSRFGLGDGDDENSTTDYTLNYDKSNNDE